jgi:hypothetical protein
LLVISFPRKKRFLPIQRADGVVGRFSAPATRRHFTPMVEGAMCAAQLAANGRVTLRLPAHLVFFLGHWITASHTSDTASDTTPI